MYLLISTNWNRLSDCHPWPEGKIIVILPVAHNQVIAKRISARHIIREYGLTECIYVHLSVSHALEYNNY